MIPRSRRNLFSFGENDNAGTKAGKSHAGGALMQRKRWGGEVERTGNGAVTVGERGDGERLWVSAWCLRKVYKECELN